MLIHQAPTSGELIQLELSDIDLEKATIQIKPTSSTNNRILPLKAEQILLLQIPVILTTQFQFKVST